MSGRVGARGSVWAVQGGPEAVGGGTVGDKVYGASYEVREFSKSKEASRFALHKVQNRVSLIYIIMPL